MPAPTGGRYRGAGLRALMQMSKGSLNRGGLKIRGGGIPAGMRLARCFASSRQAFVTESESTRPGEVIGQNTDEQCRYETGVGSATVNGLKAAGFLPHVFRTNLRKP